MYSTITRHYVTGCILPMCVFSILWPVGVLDENKNLCVSKKQRFYRSSLRHLIPCRKYNRNSWRHLQRAKRKTNRVHLIPHNSPSVFYGNYLRLGIHVTYKVTVYTTKFKQNLQTDKSLTLRLLMSYIYIYIYEAPILDVSRSHTTTQHSR